MTKPKYIYKYCSAERAIQVLSECSLYLCPPEKQNDLCEFNLSRFGKYDPERAKFLECLRWKANGADSELANSQANSASEAELRYQYEYFERGLHNLNSQARVHSGITSFSATFLDQRMFATYGDNHAGVCIQFSNVEGRSHVHKHLLPVTYTDEIADDLIIKLIKPNGSIDVEVLAREMYLVKSTDWRDECEWRILMLADKEQSKADRMFGFPADNIRRIFLGPRISPNDRKQILEIGRQHIRDWSVIDIVPVPNHARFEFSGVEIMKSLEDSQFWDDHQIRAPLH